MNGTVVQNKSNSVARIKLTSSTMYRFLFALLWTQYTVFPYLRQIILRLPLINAIADYILPVLIVIAAFLSVPHILKKCRYTDIAIYAVSSVAILVTWMFSGDDILKYLEPDLVRILVYVMPFFFVGLGFEFKKQKRMLFWLSLVGVMTTFVYQIFLLYRGVEMVDDNMDAAYKLLPSTLYLIYTAFEWKRLRYWLATIPGIVLIFSYGTRGAMLCMFVFIAVCLYQYLLKSRSMAGKFVFAVVALVLLIFITSGTFFVSAVEWIADKFSGWGFSTRIFDMFLAGDIAHDNGRDPIIRDVWEAISNEPIIGHGIMSDRVFAGNYAHNLFLELWCQFGVILGTVIFMLLAWIPLKSLFKVKSADAKMLIWMYICMVFVKLMLSGSYLHESNLFFMLGMCLTMMRNQELTKGGV